MTEKPVQSATDAETLAVPPAADPAATGPGPAPPPLDGSVPPELADHPRYHVVALIGQGGMGAVYKAEHRRMERPVALKVINPAFMDNPSAVRRFQQEVKAAARLHHPHIVESHDADQAGSLHFLVMEYVEGRSLADYVQEKGPLPVHEACEYARQAALGLQHAHEHGLVHRDIKPHNLMRTPEGQIKILDFGLARLGLEAEAPGPATADGSATGELTTVGAVVGTADYMAPEQASDSHTADIRADVYSLGCTLYYLLTGSVPFPGGTALDKLTRHTAERLPEPGLRGGRTGGLTAVLRKMTAKAPADRFPTPGEAARALAPFAVPPRKRRPRRLVALAWTALILAAGCVAWMLWPGPPGPPGPRGPGAEPFPGPLVAPGAPSPADALTHDAISPEALAWVGRGDPKAAPAELVAVLGDARFRYYGEPGFPAYSPDGKTLAVPSGADILLFDAGTGQFRRSLLGHAERVGRTAFSPDGKALASVGYDGKVMLWDAATGRDKGDLFGPGRLTTSDAGLAFVPAISGAWLAAGGENGEVLAWDLSHDNRIKTFPGARGQLVSLAANSQGSLLAAGSKTGAVYVWDFTSGQLMKSFVAPDAGLGMNYITVAFSPNGELLAAGDETKVKVWRTADFTELWSAEAAGAGLTAFTPDGATLLTDGGNHGPGAPHGTRRWRAADGKEGTPLALPTVDKGDWVLWALRPDGKEAAAAVSTDRVVSLYDLETGRRRFPASGHTADVRTLAFSPDGRTLASGAEDGLVKIWDLASARELRTLSGHVSSVRAVAFSPDGTTLASAGGDAAIRLWNPADGSPLHVCTGHTAVIQCLAFHPSGRTLASCGYENRLRFWDVASGAADGSPVSVSGNLDGLAYRPDGRILASLGTDGLVAYWDAATHVKVNADENRAALTKGAFLPSGGPLALADIAGEVRLRDPDTATVLRTLPGKAVYALGKLAVRPDGGMIAAAGFDGCLRLWDLGADPPRRKVLQLAPMKCWVDAVAFSPDGRYLAAGNPDGTISLFRLAPAGRLPVLPDREGSFREERVLAGHSHEWVTNVAFEADSRHVLTADFAGKVRRWDADSDAAAEVFDGCPNVAWSAAFTADGRTFAGCHDGKARLWDYRAGKEIYFCNGHTSEITAVALSADGRLALTGGEDGGARLWQASGGKALKELTGHTAAVRAVALSADGGRALTGSLDGTARLWDTASARHLRVFTGYQRMHAHGLCLSADGARAAWGGADGLVHVWDLVRDEEALRLPFNDGFVRGIAFSPDGKRLLAGGDKGLLAIWEAETGRVLDLTRTEPMLDVAFSPDGRRAVTGHADKTARVWRLPELEK